MNAQPLPADSTGARSAAGFGARAKRRNILPGFGLSMGVTLTYLCLMALIPLSTIFLKSAGMGWARFLAVVAAPRVLAAYRLSFTASLAGAGFDAFAGLLLAWVLVRYEFPGRDLADALVDLPFALPTSVAGITLTTMYAANGWVGKYFAMAGIKVAFAPLGIVVAMAFIGLPFVVRAVQPVLRELEPELEEAAATLGAGRLQTFRRVIGPALMPPMLTGFTLAFARALGEYGSVVFISGNMPMRTEIVPLLIMTKLEQFDYQGATAIALVTLVASFAILLLINLLQRRTGRFYAA
jgi:sulfate/thiosulfate transport system permease protein